MANIKSQKKRAITNLKKHNRRVGQISELKTAIKNVLKAIENKDYESAVSKLNHCNSLLDAAVSGKIKHANYASRQKSRLQVALNSIKA